MSDVHPTSSAGDGQAIFKSDRQQPGDATDKRIVCAQCGFRYNPDVRGEPRSRAMTFNTVAVTITPVVKKLPIHLRNVATFLATSKNTFEANPTDGCPLCISPNPRGDNRDRKEFLESSDHSNEF